MALNCRVALLLILLLSVPLLFAGDIVNVRYAPGYEYAGAPVIASNGNRFLTLWQTRPWGNRLLQIYGSLSDASGASNPTAFTAVPESQGYKLSVVGTGSAYAAIWSESDHGLPFFGRFTPEGVLGPRVALAGPPFSNPAFAANESRFAVVDRTGAQIEIVIYDMDGNLVRRSTVTSNSGETYAVAAVGSDFIVMTAGESGIIEWRATNDGVGQANIRILPPSGDHQRQYKIAAAARDGRIVTAWAELRSGTPSSLSSATIQPDGTVTQSSLPTDGNVPASAPVILPVDGGYVIAWNVTPPGPAKPRVLALGLDDNGVPLDDHPSFLYDGQFTGAASSGNTIKFAFNTSTTSSSGIVTVTASVEATGIAVQPAAAVLAPVPQIAPAVTGNGAGFTAAWLEEDSVKDQVQFHVLAGRVNPAGEPLDGTGIVLDSHASFAPAIAHGPSEDLIVWSADGRLKATRLSVSGHLLDATPIDIARKDEPSYDVVWNGSRFFVIWADLGGFSYAFVGPDGVTTPVKQFYVPFTSPYVAASQLNVAWDGRQYVVVYKEYAPEIADATNTIADIRVTRISAAGAVLDPVPARISFGDSNDGLVHVASSGSESLIVFDRDSGPVSVVVHGQGTTLKLDAEVPLFHWESGTSGVAWNGSAYVVATRYALSSYYLHEPGWLSVTEVSASGIPLRTATRRAAAPQDSWYPPPAIATDQAAGTALVTTEIDRGTYVPRARIYLLSEFSSVQVPPIPLNAVSSFNGTYARIDWQADSGPSGFVVDRSTDFGASWSQAVTTAADARTVTMYVKIGDLVRIRAFGPGGTSEGAIISIGSMPRRRAERH